MPHSHTHTDTHRSRRTFGSERASEMVRWCDREVPSRMTPSDKFCCCRLWWQQLFSVAMGGGCSCWLFGVRWVVLWLNWVAGQRLPRRQQQQTLAINGEIAFWDDPTKNTFPGISLRFCVCVCELHRRRLIFLCRTHTQRSYCPAFPFSTLYVHLCCLPVLLDASCLAQSFRFRPTTHFLCAPSCSSSTSPLPLLLSPADSSSSSSSVSATQFCLLCVCW